MEPRNRKKKPINQQEAPVSTTSSEKNAAVIESLGKPRKIQDLINMSFELPSIIAGIFIAYSLILTLSSYYKNGTRYLEPIYGNVIPYKHRFFFMVFSFSFGVLLAIVIFTMFCLSIDDACQKFLSKVSSKYKQLVSKKNHLSEKESTDFEKYLLSERCLENSQFDHSFDTNLMFFVSLCFDALSFFVATIPMRLEQVFLLSNFFGLRFGPLIAHISSDFFVFIAVGFISMLVSTRIAYVINSSSTSPKNPKNEISSSGKGSIFGYAYSFIVFTGAMTFSSVLPTQPACYTVLFQTILISLVGVIIKLCMHYQISLDRNKAENDYNDFLQSLTNEPLSEDEKFKRPKPTKASNLKLFIFYLPVVAIFTFVSQTVYTSKHCADEVTWKHNLNPDIQVLYRIESFSGWIEVVDLNLSNLENKPEHPDLLTSDPKKVRVLRSGHSIVGGIWNSTSESVYGVFYYFDAPLYSKNLIKSQQRSALHIGLGAGISAKSHHSHGVAVDVVDIDVAVIHCARNYFGLPENLKSINVQDGRYFVEKSISDSYDFVVHDIFSGGSINSYMLSTEFLNQTHRILKPSGILALNYVGFPTDSRSIGIIQKTLLNSFKHVRLFVDNISQMDSLQNLVCTISY
ncbi:Polyamine aminopropyltransferase [Smittium culicis]|uniref:Polyamine aminopropyltransferase n=1 Tax=Smittium culicis TaxID=133412 RepID=A0A1R1YCG1_9FUNG|nr:Polyamine aminopropyltransferase [Smittium culicis]